MKLINVDSTINHGQFVSAPVACEILGVKPATLYAYASRGLLHSVQGAGASRAKRYSMEEVQWLKARHDARSGHGPVAATALRWGEPVLDSAITEVTAKGPRYRGYLATELAEASIPFEAVAELLWTGSLPAGPVHWQLLPASRGSTTTGERASSKLARMSLFLATQACADRQRMVVTREAELGRARSLASAMVGALYRLPRSAHSPRTMAERLASALRLSSRDARALSLLDAALVMSADHELNVSSFAARVVASTGADLYACLSAAVAGFSGPLHGAMSSRVEALLSEIAHPRRAARAVRERLERGESLPGFAHPLYPGGDPRARHLLERAVALVPNTPAMQVLRSLVRQAELGAALAPNIDLGLVAVTTALGAATGTAGVLFALGRLAGWVAHALEQRDAGVLLRPRARYVGSHEARALRPPA